MQFLGKNNWYFSKKLLVYNIHLAISIREMHENQGQVFTESQILSKYMISRVRLSVFGS